MVSATVTVTDTLTSITINIPSNLNININNNKEFEIFLTDAIFDYYEMKQDAELRESLKNDEEFHDLNNKLDEVLWDL